MWITPRERSAQRVRFALLVHDEDALRLRGQRAVRKAGGEVLIDERKTDAVRRAERFFEPLRGRETGGGDDEIFLINAPFSGGDITYSIYDTDHDRLQAWAIPEKPAYPSGIAVDEISDKVLVTSYVMNGQWPSYDAPGYVNVYDEDTLLFIRKFNIGSGPSCIFFNAL